MELELEYSDSDLRMRICDNGCGIDPQVLEKGRVGHWGLAGMRERATKIGGLLKISSSATGTEIELSLSHVMRSCRLLIKGQELPVVIRGLRSQSARERADTNASERMEGREDIEHA